MGNAALAKTLSARQVRAMVTIRDEEMLRSWLQKQEPHVAAIIAARAALRVLPIICNPAYFRERRAQDRLTAAVFRALTISAVAAKYATAELRHAAYDAFEGVGAAFADVVDATALAADAAVAAARAAAYAADAFADATALAANAAAFAADAVGTAVHAAAFAAAVWQAASHDCTTVDGGGVKALLTQPLWPDGGFGPLVADGAAMRATLTQGDDGFGLWMDWYDRRLRGEAQLFALPPDADEILARRLVAQDDAWWIREPAAVNAEIQSWIDGLTPLEPLPDPQSHLAPQFGAAADGRITLDRMAGHDAVAKDAGAQTRHAALGAALRHVAVMFRGRNNGGHFASIADALLSAIGDDIDGLEPSLTVLSAETLRQALTLQQAAGPSEDQMPLTGLELLAVTGAVDAANLLIGSDAYLDAMDRVRAGPDVHDPLIESETVRAVAVAAANDGVADDAAVSALVMAADQAPSPSQRGSRQTGLLTGIALNFVRYTTALLMTNPREILPVAALGAAATAGTVGIMATATAVGAAGALVGTGYALVRYVKANEAQLRAIAAMSPITAANFDRMMILLNQIPTKSLKDE